MRKTLSIGQSPLSPTQLAPVMHGEVQLKLAPEALERVEQCYRYLQDKLSSDASPVYGVNTGFGALCDTRIPSEDLQALQTNLVMSHACGTGEEVPPEIVRLMLALKAHALALGHSGVRPLLIERLLDLYNTDMLPVVYAQGSLGASGDLAPLAHLSLPLLGMGEVMHQGKRLTGEAALQQLKCKALTLHAKEGLALLNGTQFMTAYGVSCLLDAHRLYEWAHASAALSADVYQCRTEPFDGPLQDIRRHAGQQHSAKLLRQWLKGSKLATTKKAQVQDPYAFRCIPQVHGAVWQTIQHAEEVLRNELQAVTDNPAVFPEEDRIRSGGNFHGENLALALDYLAMGLAELGSIAERRTYKLLCGERGLPDFLVANPGLHSGLMIVQYTAAAIVSQNKQYCTPASVDSITSSHGQEDHVSMGANAAVKARKVTDNLQRILAIEWLTACQALEFRRPKQTGGKLEEIVKSYRKKVLFAKADRPFYKDIAATVAFLDGSTT